MASVMAVMKGQVNACKRRCVDVMEQHGELLLGQEKFQGTQLDKVGSQFYDLALECEYLFSKIDRLTDLIRQNGEMPVLEKNPLNSYFRDHMKKELEKALAETKDMDEKEAAKHLEAELKL